MEDFCGSKFWDAQLTWETNSPDLTPCMEKTLLTWIPCGFLWLTASIKLYVALRSKKSPLPDTSLSLAKGIVPLILTVFYIIQFGFSFRKSRVKDFKIHPVDHVAPAVKAATFGLALALKDLDKFKGIANSGILFLFWTLAVICEVFPFQTELRALPLQEENEYEVVEFAVTVCSFPLILLQFILQFYSDVPLPKQSALAALNKLNDAKERYPCPERISSFPSQLTFQWFWPLVNQGRKKALEFDELWNLNPEDETKAIVDRFTTSWQPAFEKAQRSNVGNTGKQKIAGISWPLFISNRELLIPQFIYRIIQDLLIFVAPFLLDSLILHVGSDDDEAWKGYLYAALLFVNGSLQTLLMNQHYHNMFLVGMRIRTAIIGAVFKKSLVVSSAARKGSTLGEIVNLVSVDAHRFVDLAPFINELWSAPLTLLISLYFLWNTLGASVLGGLAVMILLVPLNIFIQKKNKQLVLRQMEAKDDRVKLMNEVLSGIKVLKLYAWEPSFEAQINSIRKKELSWLKSAAMLNSIALFIWSTSPFLVSLVTFGTYVLMDDNNILDARKAFVSLTYFNIMRRPMSVVPYTLGFVVAASVSLKRINNFMNSKEIDLNNVTHYEEPSGNVVSVEDGNFSWDESPILRNINFSVQQASLVAVVGPVGSGKTSLLSAILGEMEKVSGKVNTHGSIAYVAQQAWMRNATLRDNILFGAPFDATKYNKVIEACALKPDLKILPGGDMTEIGEKGINLSGGQKQRISLARAVYNDADIYLLDDPLSAVDSHVGKHLFDEVVGPRGMLRKKTRVFVTHGVTYLPRVDSIVVMNSGEITEVGTYNQLVEQKGAFSEFLAQHAGLEDTDDFDAISDVEGEEPVGDLQTLRLRRQRSRVSESDSLMSVSSIRSRRSIQLAQDKKLERRQSKLSQRGDGTEKLISTETVETGNVSGDVYKHYFQAVSVPYAVPAVISLFIMQGFLNGSSVWLSQWADENTKNGTDIASSRDLYLGVYGAFGAAQGVASLLGNALMALGCIRAASIMHQLMLTRILRSPMSFFDTTPLGRILNRFSKDVDTADTTLAIQTQYWFLFFLQVAGTLVVISYSTPWFLLALVPVGVLYYLVQRLYLSTTRQLKRLESLSRSPINSHFGETVSGATTIRAYGTQQQFILHSEYLNDQNQISYYPAIVALRWLTVRLETIANLVVFCSALFAVVSGNGESSIGLAVSYALSMTHMLNMLVRSTSEVETNIVSVERIKEYGEVPQEALWEVPANKPPPNWPSEGRVTFADYQTRYREGLDLVLRGISCSVEPGEKVGIVGRTGAGKSSLTLALFRIIEAAGGHIEIDGKKLSELGLHDVRGKLTIIPQDPVLFSGSLRMNLDPFCKHTDDAVWRALEYAHLKSFVTALPSQLEYSISEGGENLSVGQRQLVCLARALLWKTKILILDEATAAVDLETDDLIQKTIRTEFNDCTVLTIAHRLNTIMDSTRVMVLDQGMIREFASPQELLQDKNSIFYGMAKDAGLV